jgi:hypothetical protein
LALVATGLGLLALNSREETKKDLRTQEPQIKVEFVTPTMSFKKSVYVSTKLINLKRNFFAIKKYSITVSEVQDLDLKK